MTTNSNGHKKYCKYCEHTFVNLNETGKYLETQNLPKQIMTNRKSE